MGTVPALLPHPFNFMTEKLPDYKYPVKKGLRRLLERYATPLFLVSLVFMTIFFIFPIIASFLVSSDELVIMVQPCFVL